MCFAIGFFYEDFVDIELKRVQAYNEWYRQKVLIVSRFLISISVRHMKKNNIIDNVLVTCLSVVLISSIIFVGCSNDTKDTETTEVVKATEDSEVEDVENEETTEADADSIIAVVDDFFKQGYYIK